MKEDIKKLIVDSILQLQGDGAWSKFSVSEVIVERPKDLTHGDWTTNIAFALAKELKKTPLAIAEELAVVLKTKKIDDISDIGVVQPGYINFTTDRAVLIEELKNIIIAGDEYGQNNIFNDKTVAVEYTQPNPFKPFHIGHLMSNTIGESLSRIIEFSGASVIRMNYQGDVGLHVAKALWAVKKHNFDINDINQIGEAYAKGHAAFEDNESVQSEIQEINKAIYHKSDAELMRLYDIGRKKTLERFEEIYKVLGTKFDQYFFESETWESGEKIVRENMDTVFEESEGAIIFDGEKYDLHKRVFITKNNLPTYETKDLGLAVMKKTKTPSDFYLITTAVEQEEYFKVVKKALELVDPSFEGKLRHVPHGMMQLKSGKMSSRKGNVITGESLIEDAQAVASEKMSDRASGGVEKDTIDMIAVAGLKFSVLKQRAGKNITYDTEAALSFDGDSGPYIQYTYARCKSVIAKAQEEGIESNIEGTLCENSRNIEKTLLQFGEVVERAGRECAPHFIANYVLNVAHAYNAYYTDNIIVDLNNKELSGYRVSITMATAQVIKNSMYLLGIKVPEQM